MGEPDKIVKPGPDQAERDLREALREAIVRRVAWQKPAIVLSFLGLTALAYWAIQEKREDGLRTQVLMAQQGAVRRYGSAYERLREKVRRLVSAEAGAYRGDFRDPVFRVVNLPDGGGVYLRLPLDRGRSGRSIEKAARVQTRDAVAGCLGVSPRRFGTILDDGTILDAGYRAKIQKATSQDRLRALDQDMVVRIRRDLPQLAEHLRPDWLFAVLDEPGGAKPPRRAILWDLRRDRVLVRARLEVADDVIPVRWVGKGAIRSNAPPDRTVRNTASDCSIAASIRRLTNEAGVQVDTAVPAPAEPVPAAPATVPAAP